MKILGSYHGSTESETLGAFSVLFIIITIFFMATYVAYGSSQARGQIGAVTASLCQSHSNARSELHLRPTLQFVAMPEP